MCFFCAFESYEQATASYFPTGDSAIIHLNIILDNTDAKLIFTPVEMITKSARIEFATIFYDKHLTAIVGNELHRPIDLLSRAFTATRDRTPHLTERMLLLQVQRDGSDEQYLPSVDQRRRQLTKFDPSFSPLTKPNRRFKFNNN